MEEIQNSEKLITVLLQDSKDIGDETKPRIILVAEDEKIIQEYEAKSQIYTQRELRSGLEIEPTNGLYHDEVPRYTNEPETFSILKNQENKYRI